ncbi:MAG: hypothetical protein OK454_12320, partial [Thaumarchaeota archaeon]|nr:hypothetical protein [Nitrososphaerota archaeon]
MGIAAAERVLTRANEAVDRDMLDEAVEELITRVDDWKNHVVKQFGRLILHGVYTVVTGKSDQEKDVRAKSSQSSTPLEQVGHLSVLLFLFPRCQTFLVPDPTSQDEAQVRCTEITRDWWLVFCPRG